jgi:hypothetical protein
MARHTYGTPAWGEPLGVNPQAETGLNDTRAIGLKFDGSRTGIGELPSFAWRLSRGSNDQCGRRPNLPA